MLSVCSEFCPSRRRAWLRAAVGVVGVLCVLEPVQTRAQQAPSSGRWRLGVFPVASFVRFSSHYGSRIGPGGSVEPHHGLDIAAPLGSAIHSWWGGVVQEVISDGACGVGLVIRSGDYEHVYCHLAGAAWGGTYRSGPVSLRQGQAVATGQLIGHVGLSGRTTGPHLHWGVRYRGQWLDPARVLRAMVASRGASKRQPAPRVGGN
jgi:murein DD-endopeptidase MepM/ murein hydrolase activator NlpD